MSDSDSDSSSSQASESSRGESSVASSHKLNSKSSANATPSPKNKESPMSVPTPDYIANTEAWRADTGMMHDITLNEHALSENLEDQVIRPFERLTSTARVVELENLLKSAKKTAIDPTCVRTTANWATVEKQHKFDKPEFNAKQTAEDLVSRSPKLAKILQQIRKLDREDEVRYGHKFKHFIFSDIKSAQGAKAVASGLLGAGFQLGYDVRQTAKKTHITVKSDAELLKTKSTNFFLLSSVSLYGEPLLVSVKKEVLKKFNLRPSNVYGDLARIIVMDSGFKEGIDLFDIKYIHIFEPQTTQADQKQVIGRGTRTCGQKGLKFHPQQGWPLYVFKYDLSISPEYRNDFHGATTAFAYYLQSKNVDIRLLNLSSNLERLAIKGSVDYKLNKPIHQFSINSSESSPSKGGKRDDGEDDSDDDDEDDTNEPPKHLRTAEENLMRKLSESSRPGKKYKAVKKYIKKYFSEYTWDAVKMENLCGYEGPQLPSSPSSTKSLDRVVGPNKQNAKMRVTRSLGGAPNRITLSPTQDFISNYFSVDNPIKGMVLWQSVGTGKTCTAIATATRQFEPLGYTILWVTRTTLKNDIWKNMFEMVCHEGIRDKIDAGVPIPEDMPSRMRLLSKSWGVRPISYKQFSNLVSKNNQYYDQLVKRNGEDDPLRKTLIIIDEAHKLYGGGDLSSIERPDMPAFHKALMNSYAVSGKDSVRVLFMTATPITENPLELVKLVNLCKPAENQMPTEFEMFADAYLDDVGDFTPIGQKLFLDDIAGHISYLNREGDVRQFSHPILREVPVPLVDAKTANDIEKFDVIGASQLDRRADELKVIADEAKVKYNTALDGFTKGNAVKVARVCDEFPPEERDACYKIAKKYSSKMLKTAKARVAEWKQDMTDVANQWRDAKKIKGDRFKSVRQTRKDHPTEFEDYQKSAYYKLKECEKEWKDVPNFDQFLETQLVFTRARDLEEVIREEVVNVDTRLKSDIAAQQSRIRSYNKLLKTELRPLEEQVVKRTIVDAKKKMGISTKRNTKWMKRITKRANASIDTLKKFQKNAKTEIRKVVKEQVREEKQFAKEERKEQKLVETADADLTETFRESLREAQEGVRINMQEKRDKADAKIQGKIEKARLAEEKKLANKTRKLEEKAQKDAQNAANKTRKMEEKAQQNAEKKAQKEAEKAHKDAEKKAQKEAKNTTRKTKK